MKYNEINENVSNKYKYIVNGIESREELNKIMNYDIHIVGIVFRNYDGEINNLPQSLKSLVISGDNFNQPLDKLPPHLKILKISRLLDTENYLSWSTFNRSIDKLPQTLKSLTINGHSFNQSTDKLPQTLKSLKISGSDCRGQFNISIDNLPQSLKLLNIY